MDQEFDIKVECDDSPSAQGCLGGRIEDRDRPSDKEGEDNSGPGEQSRIYLNVSPSYVGDWDATTAFRELYQNWKDAIIHSFNLNLRDFRPLYQENGDFISITVPEMGSNTNALGFIRYEKEYGRVVLVNACAQLRSESLQLGHTSKKGQLQFAGCHGEGLKLAAMVMCREGYSVSIETGNSHWSFAYGGPSKTRFYCNIGPLCVATPEVKLNPAQDMACFTYRTWRDVCVEVGPDSEGTGGGVSIEEFRQWLTVSLDIHGHSYPESIIETDQGDLIIDPRFRGKTFLKGLLLPASVLEARPFELSYNFVQGGVNRDRQRLVSRYEQADMVRRIWESAIRENEALTLPIYVNLLRNFPRAPDVELADQLLDHPTRFRIWKYLMKEAGDEKFYFCQKTGSQSVGSITKSLRKEPAALPDTLWNLLRGVTPIRTAYEEQVDMFQNANVCECHRTLFAVTIRRALWASMALCGYPTNIQFVHSDNSQIDMVFDMGCRTLKIHDRWLDPGAVHYQSPCRPGMEYALTACGPFFCDHVVEELFTMVQGEMSRISPSVMNHSRRHKEIRLVRSKLRMMPRDVFVRVGSIPGTLRVSWQDGETASFLESHGSHAAYHVILHEEKCAGVMAYHLHGDKVDIRITHAPCGCMQRFTPQNQKRVEFDRLDIHKKYFPMIAANERAAFFGQPTSPIHPARLPQPPFYTRWDGTTRNDSLQQVQNTMNPNLGGIVATSLGQATYYDARSPKRALPPLYPNDRRIA
ncbi:hypothetical protein KXV78_000430 [Aspergillus fumigatus]|nr:hypothetical protein KXW84_002020 [Aspergillus fumigatus]KAH3464030.1 hypothetical protein KXV78_000430 [Aspergillus fumigatus]